MAHEYLFLFSKSERYFFNQDAIKEPTATGAGLKNRRTVWQINTEPLPEAHFAAFPKTLVRPCLLASTRPGDLVLDPFLGAGTVGVVASETGRRWMGIELNDAYVRIARRRTSAAQPDLIQVV